MLPLLIFLPFLSAFFFPKMHHQPDAHYLPHEVSIHCWLRRHCLHCLGDVLSRHSPPATPVCRETSCHICSGDLLSSPPRATRVISRRWSSASPHLWKRLSESKPRITIVLMLHLFPFETLFSFSCNLTRGLQVCLKCVPAGGIKPPASAP